MAQIDYPGHVGADTERFAEAIERGPLDASIGACPGWDLQRLALHLGHIHRWARIAAATGAAPDATTVPGPPDDPSDPRALADWLRAGGSALVDTLSQVDPAAPTWHPFPVPLVAGVWPRRQAQETQVHRWDAQRAVGDTEPLDPALASDGIDEYLTMMLPRLLQRDGVVLPEGSLHLTCTDTPGCWTVSSVGGEMFVSGCPDETDPAGAGDATGSSHPGRGYVHGTAEQILLTLWGRSSSDDLRIDGAREVAAEWLAVGGT